MTKKTASSLATLAALVSTSLYASAQRPGVPPAPAPVAAKPVALPVQLQPVTVDPTLRAALATKARFDPAKLAAKVTVQNGRPVMQLTSGKKVVLEPAGAEPVPPASLQMKQLPSKLAPFQAHVDSPYVIGKRIPKLADGLVSHQNEQTAVRDQGGRGTCTAFASMAGFEGWAKRIRGKTIDLSENHAFSVFKAQEGTACTVSGGYTTWKTAEALTNNGVCAESAMPYTSDACPSGVPQACSSAAGYKLVVTTHFFSTKYGGAGNLHAQNTNLLETWLKAGFDLVYGVDVAGTDWSDGTMNTGIVDVQVDGNGNPAGSAGGHAMLLVGYNRAANYFIFKNSWGTDSGHDGYVRLSYEYIQTYGKYGYAISDASGPNL
jgi:hypothetical protein